MRGNHERCEFCNTRTKETDPSAVAIATDEEALAASPCVRVESCSAIGGMLGPNDAETVTASRCEQDEEEWALFFNASN